MNVSLTSELDRFVQEQVASGMYCSASEVIREALRLLEERQQLRQVRIEELRKQIAVGLGQLDRGESVPMEQVFRELRQIVERHKNAEGREAE